MTKHEEFEGEKMYTYQQIRESGSYQSILDRFFSCFIDTEAYNDFARKNQGAFVYSFDFLKNSKIADYFEIVEAVKHFQADSFYIMWNLSQRYINGELEAANYQLASIAKHDLIDLLEDQMNDMQGNQLCYYKNMERAQYWDLFVFDSTMMWCYAITHEEREDGARLCFMA